MDDQIKFIRAPDSNMILALNFNQTLNKTSIKMSKTSDRDTMLGVYDIIFDFPIFTIFGTL